MYTKSRLHQVRKRFSLPLLVRASNALPEEMRGLRIHQFLKTGFLGIQIPEVIIPNGNNASPYCDEWNKREGVYAISKDYSKTMSEIASCHDKDIKPEEFVSSLWLDADYVNTHAFYEPKADVTYIFPWINVDRLEDAPPRLLDIPEAL